MQSESIELAVAENVSETEWEIGTKEQQKYEAIFYSLNPVENRLSGDQCRPILLNSQLPRGILAKIWDLADIESDGFLDRSEFCVALHLVYSALQSKPIPERLPSSLIPREKRSLIRQLGTRSVDLAATHPPPLTWSSRASSITSLNLHQLPPQSPTFSETKPAALKPLSLFNKNIGEWCLDNLNQFETEFAQLDKDNDGLVGGGDVRDLFLRSGLPQATLAKIWTHVDVHKTGRINLEQYAKCVLLIHECQREGSLVSQSSNLVPAVSSPVPTAMTAALARRDSQISTNSQSSGVRPLVAENPRVQELTVAIEEMQQMRRKAEQNLFQAEADLKVKNSEVKNLEIELLTLEATVKQLRVQRVEANKRLNDLDTKLAKLESHCGENQHRVEEEEVRLQKTKYDILQARENSDLEDAILEKLRAESKIRIEKLGETRSALEQRNTKFEAFVDELTQMERVMARQEIESVRLKEQIMEMCCILDGLESGAQNAKQELLEKTFEEKPCDILANTACPLQALSTAASFSDLVKNGLEDDPFFRKT